MIPLVDKNTTIDLSMLDILSKEYQEHITTSTGQKVNYENSNIKG